MTNGKAMVNKQIHVYVGCLIHQLFFSAVEFILTYFDPYQRSVNIAAWRFFLKIMVVHIILIDPHKD
jgi:hypothetical protein